MKVKKTVFLILVFLSFTNLFFSQQNQTSPSFPQGSTQGRTQMSPNITGGITIPNVTLQVTEPKTGQEVAFSVRLLLLLTVLTLAPSILILLTCFLRFSIVLDFIKRALSLQQVPPTAVLNGIALFMTLFVMWPVFTQIYNDSFKPLAEGKAGIEETIQTAQEPIKYFMLKQLSDDYRKGSDNSCLGLFCKLAKISPNSPKDLPIYVLIPSYILHELTIAFKIGIILYIPFIIIDMVVASILMSMGMMMLPPVQISMPFKLLLFVLVDGWNLLTEQLFISVTRLM